MCKIIEKLIPEIDRFVETYRKGLLSEMPELKNEEISKNGDKVYLVGMWRVDNMNKVLNGVNHVLTEIEHEFRKIYGTNN